MEWIDHQFDQQFERLETAFSRWWFNIGCDRRRRLRTFTRLVVVQLIYLILLEWMNWQRYSYVRAAVIVLVKTGFVLTTIVEYLGMIRIEWINFEIDLAVDALMINMFGNFASLVCVSAIARDAMELNASFRWLFRLLEIWIHHQIVCQIFRWFFGIRFSAAPIRFQIRKLIPGQHQPQMLRLLIWNHQDRCELLLPNQWPVNVPFIEVPPVPDYVWPTMDEAPWWILMKLSENAAAAG